MTSRSYWRTHDVDDAELTALVRELQLAHRRMDEAGYPAAPPRRDTWAEFRAWFARRCQRLARAPE